jgi:hypothetical protein
MNDESPPPEGASLKIPIGSPVTIKQALRTFVKFPNPMIYAIGIFGAGVARLAIGRWNWRDLLVVFALWALWPLQEWLLHVYILHFRPRRLGRWRIDLFAGRKHRAHHRETARLDLVFIPTGIALSSLVVLPLAWLLPLPLPTGLTGILFYLLFALNYEWVHFLIHSTYRPKSKYYRGLWTNHRLHHFRNEHYWFGVSRFFGDKILRTNPDPKTVEISPTCMTLGLGGSSQ